MKTYITDAILAVSAISTMASCVSESELDDFAAADDTITISTYIGNSRSESKTAFEIGDKISLFASTSEGEYAGAFSHDLMNNVQATLGEDGWSYSPIVGWPADDNTKVSFAAFYPTTQFNNTAGYYFSLNNIAGSQVDALWCTVKDASIYDRNGKAINGSEDDAAMEPNSGPLNLKFRHLLSKINVNVKLAESYEGVKVKLLSTQFLNPYRTGYVRLNDDLSDVEWHTLSSAATHYIHQPSSDPLSFETNLLTLPSIFVLPQSATLLRLSYSYLMPDAPEEIVRTRDISLTGTWEKGKIYNYTVNLALDVSMITVDANATNWDGSDAAMGNTLVEPVDLGLPSGTKWAPFDYGAYSTNENSSLTYTYGTANSFSASSRWGAGWRTTKNKDWSELFSYCNITKSDNRYIVTSKINGNSIQFFQSKYWGNSKVTAEWINNVEYFYYIYYDLDTKKQEYSSTKYSSDYSTPKYSLRFVYN